MISLVTASDCDYTYNIQDDYDVEEFEYDSFDGNFHSLTILVIMTILMKFNHVDDNNIEDEFVNLK
jgi:hypothetical protein